MHRWQWGLVQRQYPTNCDRYVLFSSFFTNRFLIYSSCMWYDKVENRSICEVDGIKGTNLNVYFSFFPSFATNSRKKKVRFVFKKDENVKPRGVKYNSAKLLLTMYRYCTVHICEDATYLTKFTHQGMITTCNDSMYSVYT